MLQSPVWFLTPLQKGEHFELWDALGDYREKRSVVVASNRVDPLYKVIILSLVREGDSTPMIA